MEFVKMSILNVLLILTLGEQFACKLSQKLFKTFFPYTIYHLPFRKRRKCDFKRLSVNPSLLQGTDRRTSVAASIPAACGPVCLQKVGAGKCRLLFLHRFVHVTTCAVNHEQLNSLTPRDAAQPPTGQSINPGNPTPFSLHTNIIEHHFHQLFVIIFFIQLL